MDSNVPFQAYRRNYTDVFIDALLKINELRGQDRSIHLFVQDLGESLSQFMDPTDERDKAWLHEWDEVSQKAERKQIAEGVADKHHYRLCWRAFIQKRILVRGGVPFADATRRPEEEDDEDEEEEVAAQP